jgi:hypothetical protein
MQRLEVSCAVRPIYRSLGSKGIVTIDFRHLSNLNNQGEQVDWNDSGGFWFKIQHF